MMREKVFQFLDVVITDREVMGYDVDWRYDQLVKMRDKFLYKSTPRLSKAQKIIVQEIAEDVIEFPELYTEDDRRIVEYLMRLA